MYLCVMLGVTLVVQSEQANEGLFGKKINSGKTFIKQRNVNLSLIHDMEMFCGNDCDVSNKRKGLQSTFTKLCKVLLAVSFGYA